jgi:hypothetical protein
MKISSRRCQKCGKAGMYQTVKGEWRCLWCYDPKLQTEEENARIRQRREPSQN